MNLFPHSSSNAFIVLCAATASLVFVSVARSEEPVANVVLNGNFEEWIPATSSQTEDRKGQEFQCATLSEGLVADGFDLICEKPGDPPGVTIVRDGEDKHEGAYSIKISNNDNGQIGSAYSKRFPIERGRKYKLSLWYKMESVDGNGVAIWVAQGPAATFSESGKSTLFRPTVSTGFADWTPFETEFEADGEAEVANVCLQLQGASGTVWFDDLVITPLDPDSAAN